MTIIRNAATAAAIALAGSFYAGTAMAQDAAATTEAAAPAITEMAVGAEDAPITFIEYASFTCPHCANFHNNQYQQLKENYIDTGKVRFVFREVYFDRFGLWASMIARCGDNNTRFFGINDLLYENQQGWIGSGDPAEIANNLRAIGREAGMSDAAIDACMADQALAEGLVGWFTENAERDNVTATPTLFINGQQYGNMSYENLAAILDAELAKAQ
ncbi:DsbA family protein [Ketogulonicigenium vulgare]|uniref:Thiol-disulfide oxidoreductase D, putative n=1 Tax=Ketogulonicigenium vulgare (strain WSH-001) TaxID=759362 RepID=F9Y6L0_KETVW|nr:DsbA family protein [Ketogulonicigenium vulgare]ADO43872.1 periplasmic thiol-disulfide interchange protein [Ketogulonicigenium vulgare Y25]AEM42130.1 Thiol-disulfide oxidoreductase D, putative [Ketogulonicigenium vulgare WSH-001]ALJ79755.1 thiol-disulfide oxidoreductase [Ketogulonicigenium vulgare]ANW32677.1 thiol-disulfide oxidoreductase [Ketogulonicigenium vulgare]AOZ55906.1 periplasmic thiol-disulfide interchange protein [Ketogulonicigenium vulgare]